MVMEGRFSGCEDAWVCGRERVKGREKSDIQSPFAIIIENDSLSGKYQNTKRLHQ